MAVTEFQEVRVILPPFRSHPHLPSPALPEPFSPLNSYKAPAYSILYPFSSPVPKSPPYRSKKRVYTLLTQIPPGRITSYAHLARALQTSPRAVGGALRKNPFAPEVPCHRVIAADGFVGGFMGDWEKAPSGINQGRKLELLAEEGVGFDAAGRLLDEKRWFSGPWRVTER